jgi:ATP-dependent DNA helicase RecG
MDFQHVLQMILRGESNTLEFKKSSANLKHVAETLCAFSNGKAGTVLIGVSDKGQIIGQQITDHTKQEIANILRKFEPSINIETQYIPYQEDKQVIALTVHPDSHAVPYTFDGKAYERNESTTSIMSQGRYQQLLMARNLRPVSWESQPAIGIMLSDLDENEILNTLNDITRKKRLEASLGSHDILDILKRLKLIESENITNAAVVLFAKEI